MKSIIYIIIGVWSLLMSLTACDRDAHEGDNGLTVTLDNSSCPSVPIEGIMLYLFDADGNRVVSCHYADARALASSLLAVEAGHYTVVAVINTVPGEEESKSLTALHEWVGQAVTDDSAGHLGNASGCAILSGSVIVDVAGSGITRAIVSLRQEAFPLPKLRILLTLPEPHLPDYTPAQAKGRAAEAGYTLRCVVELYNADAAQSSAGITQSKAGTITQHQPGTAQSSAGITQSKAGTITQHQPGTAQSSAGITQTKAGTITQHQSGTMQSRAGITQSKTYTVTQGQTGAAQTKVGTITQYQPNTPQSRAGKSKEPLLRRVITPTLQADGTSYLIELEAGSGNYELHLWTDYARTDAPQSDTYYHTENLQAITLVTEPEYRANTDAKDAAYHVEHAIALPEAGAEIRIQLQRPLAKYRIMADDVPGYRRLTEIDATRWPPLEELTVAVYYENFFPSTFNILNDNPTDALTGIRFSRPLPAVGDDDTEVQVASDWVMVNGKESSVSVTVVVTDGAGRVVSSTSGIVIPYRRSFLTTIRGDFLTAGVSGGGIHIDTDWEGSFEVWF